MKVRAFLFLMLIWAASVYGTVYGAGLAQRVESPSSASREDNGPDPTREATKDGQLRGGGGQTGGGYLNEQRNAPKQGTKGLPKQRPSEGRPPASDPLRFGKTQANHNSRMDAHGNGLGSLRSSTPSAGGPDSLVNHSHRSVRPPAAAAGNGQPFRHAHSTGASLAISGGPANSTRGTAVINGTDMRKP
jgi:hypothetical protein